MHRITAPRASRAHALSFLLLAAMGLPACGGGGGGHGSDAPLCTDLYATNPRALFTVAAVPAASVEHALVFGDMDPGTLEPINFELGFQLNAINVPVRAPAELFVRSVASNAYLTGSRAGETDYQIVFDVCRDAQGRVAVEGDFAHLTTIEPVIQDIFDSLNLECETYGGAEETVEKCRGFLSNEVVIAAGTLVGTAGGTGLSSYAPGLDLNLFDTRFPNFYVNPERIGADQGPGAGFRNGACVYEYFPEPTRSSYLDRVGAAGMFRESADAPCGSMSVDVEGTAAGIWILASEAGLSINDDLAGVLGSLLVLAPDTLLPDERRAVSTELDSLSTIDGNNRLLLFDFVTTGDVNVAFEDMQPGTVHCLATQPGGVAGDAYFLLELGAGGDTLTFERVAADCSATPEADRTFSGAALAFVR